jgi:hypothetical protein
MLTRAPWRRSDVIKSTWVKCCRISPAQVQFPITYLGLSLCLGWLRMVHLQPILDRAAHRLTGWQGKLMNVGRRKELVKSVLSALPTYLLTTVKPPRKFYSAMDKLRKRFLWAGNQELHGGKCKVNWRRVCRPLQYGGLGIADLERFGRALRMRRLWCQWKQSDKPRCNSELPIDDVDRALFAAAMSVNVWNGRTTRFWTTPSVQGNTLALMFPTLFSHSQRKNRSVVGALIGEAWIRDLMHDVTTNILAEYIMLLCLIDEVGFDPADQQPDKII